MSELENRTNESVSKAISDFMNDNNNNSNNSNVESSDVVKLWQLLSVDLEKRKVVFPDWSQAKHHSGK